MPTNKIRLALDERDFKTLVTGGVGERGARVARSFHPGHGPRPFQDARLASPKSQTQGYLDVIHDDHERGRVLGWDQAQPGSDRIVDHGLGALSGSGSAAGERCRLLR